MADVAATYTTVLVVVGVLISCSPRPAESNPFVAQAAEHQRMKRQMSPGVGACMHIYTVPQQSTVCYPSQEVRDGLSDLNKGLADQKEHVKTIESRLDSIDPDKPKELPEDVVAKLNRLVEVQEKQHEQDKKLLHVTNEVKHVAERMNGVESSDRLEFARLIELQSQLIQVAMHQSNRTLHSEYINKLSASTSDLSNRLEQLQDDLQNFVRESESKINDKIGKLEDARHAHVKDVKQHLDEKIDTVSGHLNKESDYRSKFQDQVIENGRQIASANVKIEHVLEKQKTFTATETILMNRMQKLEERLDNHDGINKRCVYIFMHGKFIL